MDEFESERLAKEIYNSIEFGPLEESDARYVDLFNDYPSAIGSNDIAKLVTREIRFAGNGHVTYVTGLRGTGKSTQLLRVASQLETAGYLVVRLNAEDYLNVRRPIDIADFLMAIAGGASQELGNQLDLPEEDRFFARVLDWINSIPGRFDAEGSIGVEAGFPGAVKANANLRLALQQDDSFVAKMRQFFKDRLAVLRDEANRVVNELVQTAIDRQAEGTQWKGLVVIFDSLDHAKGRENDEADFQAVREALETLFTSHANLVALDRAHLVVCIPPFVRLDSAVVRPIPTIKVTNRDRTPNPEGRDAVREVLARRIPDADLGKLFADLDCVQQIIEGSGGNLRELQRLVRETIVQAWELPASADATTRAIATIRQQVNMNLPESEREVLRRIDRDRPSDPYLNAADTALLTPLFDRHLIMSYVNGNGFYAVHPLIDL
jgi:hypothetical protein